MKLHRVKIKNYKSIENASILLGDFNVFIGKNNVGKTNFLDCIKLIHELSIKDFFTVRDSRNGFKSLIFSGAENKQISISMTFRIGKRNYRYNLTLNDEGISNEEFIMGKQNLIHKNKDTLTISSRLDTGVHNVGINQQFSIMHPYRNGYNNFPKKYQHKRVKEIIDFISSWRFYHLSPSSMRSPRRVTKSYDIGLQGEEISLVLHTLMSEHWDLYKEIEAALVSGISDIESLHSPLDDSNPANTYIAIKERGFDSLFTQQQMSDGTLTILAHLLIIYSPQSKGLIGIEEPEDYIHPGLLKFLRDVLKSLDTQLLAITHSPYFVDALEPEDVFIVKKPNGRSIFTKATSRKDLMKFLKELTLGDILFSGELEDDEELKSGFTVAHNSGDKKT